MPIHLGPQKHDEIYYQIKNAFSDFALFEKLVAVQLRKVISDTENVEIDMKTTRKVTDRYFDTNLFQTEQQKLLLTQIQLILKTTYVLILSNSEESKKLLYSNVQELLHNYPQFLSEDEEELQYLLKFRNYLKIALLIIPARLNKQLLIKIAARLEGSGTEYITGGGQKACVTRRCDIYEREGNVAKTSKPKNKANVQTAVNQQAAYISGANVTVAPNLSGKKRANNHASLRDVKLIRLTSEEIRHLSQGPVDPFSNQNQMQPPNPTPVDYPNSSSSSIFESQRNLTVNANPTASLAAVDHPYPLQPQLSELSTFSLGFMNTEQVASLEEAGHYMPPSAYDQDTDVIESLDDLMEMRKSDTVIDQLPPLNSVRPNNNIVFVSQGATHGFSNTQQPPIVSSGTLGNLSLSSTFPPPLQREHSDVLDRLFNENTELWNHLSPPTEQNYLGPPEFRPTEISENSGDNVSPIVPLQQLNTEGSVSSVSSQPVFIPPPIQMIRTVSWDVYTGTFTEDLQQYLQNTSSVGSN
mmetsp:Transcript_17027/g.18448  ORF Transcript_17027/g.18448 Transcript_17027/m.18448 type:complete len:526 (+) Transcript_17027:151-1728(+)